MSSRNDNPNEYRFPFRTNYEYRIVIVWLVIGVCSLLIPHIFTAPKEPYYLFAGLGVLTGLFIGKYGIEISIRKKRLKGYPLTFIDPTAPSTMKLFGIKDKGVLNNVYKSRK